MAKKHHQKNNVHTLNAEHSEHQSHSNKKGKVQILPRNLSQENYVLNLANQNKRIVVAVGPAGTGKTLLAVLQAIKEFKEGKINKIIITRPTVAVANEQLGFLPGNLNQKMEPWTKPIFDIFEEYYNPKQILDMIQNNIIEICPLAFMRGRAEPLDSMIPTPTGYIQMKDIKVGASVYGSDGKPTIVTGVFPQGEKKMLKMVFSDGSTVVCSEDHLWNTRTQSQRHRNKPYTTKTAKEIKDTLKSKRGVCNHEIPLISAPIQIEHKEVPIHPYLLGLLIGDGSVSAGSIGFATADEELISYISYLLPEHLSISKNKHSIYDYRITKKRSTKSIMTNNIKDGLRELDLWGTTSISKFVPSLYKNNSDDIRLEMLRGLMDSDGTIYKHTNKSGRSRMQFYSISPQLANDVKWLVESLGGVASIRIKDTPKNGTHVSGNGHNHDVHVVEIRMPITINPFRLKRKANLFNPSKPLRLITEVIELDYQECQCISVDANDSLYLTNNMIVTHNTFKDSIIISDETQNTTPEQLMMLLTRIGEGSRAFITGDIKQTDIRSNNGLQDFIERVGEGTRTISICNFSRKDIERDPIVSEILHIYGED